MSNPNLHKSTKIMKTTITLNQIFRNFCHLQRSCFSALFLLFFLLFFGINAANAQKTWDGGGDGVNWNSANNWNPNGVPTSSDAVTLAANGSNNANLSVTVNITNAVCASLQIGGTSAHTRATLTFASSGSPKLTVTGAVTIGGEGSTNSNRGGTITFVSGSTLQAGSIILTKSTSGDDAPGIITMVANSTLLTGSFAIGQGSCTWTPSTGTVELTANNTLPSSTFTTFSNLIISGGTTTTGVALTTVSNLSVKSASTFSLSHAVTANAVSLEGGCAVTGGTISGSSTLTLGGNVTVTDNTGGAANATISCPVALSATRTFTVADDGTTANDLTMSNVISGSTFGITKSGAGQLHVSGANTYTGTTTVSAGILKMGNNAALGTSAGSTTVNSGGTLELNGFTTSDNLTLNGTGTDNIGALANNGSYVSHTTRITLGSNASIIANGSGGLFISNANAITGDYNLILGGTSTNDNGISTVLSMSTLTKNGVGNWKLSGTNTYTGVTTINAGTLILDADNTTPLGTAAGGTVVNTGGVLDLNGNTLSVAEPLTLNGTGISNGGALTNTDDDASYSGNITLGSASTITATSSGKLTCSGTVGTGAFGLTLDGEGTGTMSGVISTPTSLTKNGTGNWTLSGTNTYTGTTTVSEGTLVINNTSALGANTNSLVISTGAKADIKSNETVGSMTLGGMGTASGTWGFTGSGATNIDATFFTNSTTGKITVSTNSRTTPTVTTTVGTYTYNGAAQGPNTATNTGTGTSYTFSYTGTGGTTYTASATAPTNAGTYTVTATVAANANYNAASSSATAFTIAQAPLTITANNQTNCSGTTFTFAGTEFTTSGLVGGNTVTSASLTSTGSASNATAGTYPIVATNAAGTGLANYTISYVNGTLTVNASPTTSTTICPGGSGSLTVTSSCADITEQTSGPNNAGTGANLTGSGSTAWSNPGNITAVGSPYATVAPAQQGASNYLMATNYGFSIPDDAIINGIQLTISRSSTQSLGTGNRDDQVRLVKNNNLQATDKSSNDVYPTSLQSRTYGNATDLWGTTWTAADINNSGFGAVLSVFNTRVFGSATATVDFMQITVTYTIPGSFEWYTVSSGGTAIGSGSTFNPVGVANSGLANTNTAGTTSYYVACSTAEGSCRTKADFIISALPTVNAGTAFTKTCVANTSGAVIGETAEAGHTYSWSPSTGLSSATASNPTANPSSTTTYTVTKTNTASGCTATGTVIVTVDNQAPTVSVSANQSICAGSSATITASGATSYVWDNSLGTASSVTVSPSTTTTFQVTGTAENGCTNTASTTVAVNPNLTASVSVGASATTICSGTSVTFTATPTNGGASPIYQWKVGSTNVGNNSATYTTTSLVNNDAVTVVMTSTATCATDSPATSNTVTMTVTPASVAPTSATASVTTMCGSGSTTLTLTGGGGQGATIKWYTSSCGGTLVGTGNNLVVSPTSTTTYYGRYEGSCDTTSCASVTITFISATTTTWNGTTWSNGAPTASTAAIISGTFTSPGTNPNYNLRACKLTVNAGATVLIKSGDTVTLDGALIASPGSFVTFNSGANLIQYGTTNENTGAIVIKRESARIRRLDYTLWSSPVAAQGLQAFSPSTLSNRFYSYNSSTNFYQAVDPSATTFSPFYGYLIRTANTHPTTPATWTGQFTGVPNNGNYSMAFTGYRVIGNPYPSAIDAETFIDTNIANGSITGTVYFWRKTNGSSNAAYCTYNLGGFVSNNDSAISNMTVNPNTSTNVVQVGQGFIVEGTGTSDVVFTNDMRIDSNVNRFLRVANTIERNRIWLNITNAAGSFSQAMIAYMTGATQGVDPSIDGKLLTDGDVSLASLIETTSYAIQGRALPFDMTDVVPMSFKVTTAGDYTITIDHVDGLFSNGAQTVYLRDNTTGVVHNLSAGGYTFTSASGTFDTRFEIIYQSTSLAVSTPTFNESQVVIYKTPTNEISINTGNVVMSKVKIFDIRGRLLQEKKDINASQTLMNAGLTTEVLLVQITSEEGIVVTKKVLFPRTSLKLDKKIEVKTQLAEDE